jgi:dATP pyrophosphohydrolase
VIKRTNVQAFIFSKNPSFKVLILKRIPERSGYWQPVCGGIENAEEPKEAVIREIFEETGISNIKDIIDLNYTFTYKETKNGELMDMRDICFAIEVDSISDIRLSNEHEDHKWCSYFEAKQYLKWEHNLIALEKLMNIC